MASKKGARIGALVARRLAGFLAVLILVLSQAGPIAPVLSASTLAAQQSPDRAAPATRWPSVAQVPGSLQAAVDRSLASGSMGAGGVTLSWGASGAITLRRTGDKQAVMLRPESAGRGSSLSALSVGAFAFSADGTSEVLGHGLTVRYLPMHWGFAEGFTVDRRPAGVGRPLVITLSLGGDLTARPSGPRTVMLDGRRRPVLAYEGLRATDHAGRDLPAAFVVRRGQILIRVDDTRASYPLMIESDIAQSSTPAVVFTGTQPNSQFGVSVALSANGQEAVIGAPNYQGSNGNGIAYLFAKSQGAWSTTPVATFSPQGPIGMGTGVALSANGQEALISAEGAAYIYTAASGWAAPQATLTEPGCLDCGDFGEHVALSGNGQTALISGDNTELAFGSYGRAAFLFTDSSGVWAAGQEFLGPGSMDGGLALSDDGTAALVGSPNLQDPSGAGAAYLFTESQSAWSQSATFTGTYPSESFGVSVALSGNGQSALITGEPGCLLAGAGGTTCSNAAGAYLYTAASQWSNTPVASFGPDPSAYADFEVALSDNGQTVAVADVESGFMNPPAPQTYVYLESGGTWPAQSAAVVNGGDSMALSANGLTLLTGQAASNSVSIYSLGDPTSIMLSESIGGSVPAGSVGFVATVTDTANPAGNPVTAGTVSFYDNGSATPLITASSGAGSAAGTYSFTYAGPSPGVHSVVAVFTAAPGASYGGSTSGPAVFTITTGGGVLFPDTTTTTLSQTGGSSPAGYPVVFSGTVTDTGVSPSAPVTTGTVSLYDNGSITPLASNLPLTTSGQFSVPIAFTSAGSHSVVAVYSPPAGTGFYATSQSAPVTFSVAPPVTCTGYQPSIGTDSGADLCGTWPAGSPPPGVTTGSSGNWILDLTGTVTLPSSGNWVFCGADTQEFIISIDGQQVDTNVLYEQDGNNGDVNNQFLGTYAGTMPGACGQEQLSAGTHQVDFQINGNTSQPTSYNFAYQAPGTTPVVGLPLSILSLTSS